APGTRHCGRNARQREGEPSRDRIVPRRMIMLLQAQDLHSGYGEMEILHGVSIDLDQKEIVAVIGPNGAGKSTLIKTIFGLLRISGGQVLFDGADITGKHPRELVLQGLAYVPQTSNTFPSLTVLENLEMGAITRRTSPLPLPWNRTHQLATQKPMNDAEIRERAAGVIEMFPNLQPKLRERAGTLSGGEQQMVALAKSMMLDPTVLLIDEPSAGLAPKLVDTLFSKIVEINGNGTAIVMVEQNAKKALGIAHRGYVLETGRNRFEGTGEELLHNTDVARLYLGG